MEDRISVVIGGIYRTRGGYLVKVCQWGTRVDAVELRKVSDNFVVAYVYTSGAGAGTCWKTGNRLEVIDLMHRDEPAGQQEFQFSVA